MNIWVVVPAAGVGTRMQSMTPKQYLPLAGACVIEKTLEKLLRVPGLRSIVVALSEQDTYWEQTAFVAHEKMIRATGGKERAGSVLNGLRQLHSIADEDDWVLVHDAARPCVRIEDIENLISTCTNAAQGGILGIPVRDTMKVSTSNHQIQSTLNRDHLWHAFTPQMFRLGELTDALESALAQKLAITDEASAMELAGQQPLLVEGQPDNLKITRPADLSLAEFYLRENQ